MLQGLSILLIRIWAVIQLHASAMDGLTIYQWWHSLKVGNSSVAIGDRDITQLQLDQYELQMIGWSISILLCICAWCLAPFIGRKLARFDQTSTVDTEALVAQDGGQEAVHTVEPRDRGSSRTGEDLEGAARVADRVARWGRRHRRHCRCPPRR